ncbi:MAG: methyltransferase domain-containing protein, partial [Arenimonas sp.]|nr:methyltransferase domain-containing protein [Arenimonas sp.]
ARVLGLDVDAAAVAHARLRYRDVDGLQFDCADATALDALPDASFDLIVSFETLEHVHAQERMLDGFARLLAPGGLLLVSTPDKHAYSDLTGEVNPHHVRELYRPEFEALLQARFPARRLFGQKLLFQSTLWALDAAPGATQAVTLTETGVADGLGYGPLYFLAACGRDAGDLAGLPALSLFGDAAESVYADYRDEVRRNRAAAAHIAHLEAEVDRLRGGA